MTVTIAPVSDQLHTALHQRTVITLSMTGQSPRQIVPEKTPLSLGRSSNQDIHIPRGSVSRSHAELFTDGNDWFVVDCGSMNGTQLDGITLVARQPAKWQPEATLQIGDTTLRLDTSAPNQISDPTPIIVQERALLDDETVVSEPLQLDVWMLGADITLSITNLSAQVQQIHISAETDSRVELHGVRWGWTVEKNGVAWMPFHYTVSRPRFGRKKETVIQFTVSAESGTIQSIELPLVILSRFAMRKSIY